LQALLHAQRAAHGVYQGAPGAHIPEIGDGLRTVGIVHAQNRSLGENIRAAQARRMPVVAFNLGRTIEVALHQNRAGVSAEGERASEKNRATWTPFLRLAY